MSFDIQVSYNPVGFGEITREMIRDVEEYEFDIEMMRITLNPTTRIFIPTSRIQRIEVIGR